MFLSIYLENVLSNTLLLHHLTVATFLLLPFIIFFLLVYYIAVNSKNIALGLLS